MCEVCAGKKYLVSTRDDGLKAVERCDECSYFGVDDSRTIWDEDAALIAQADGWGCDLSYPCYVLSPPTPI